ncbi:uncharacterized protein B0T23DRAFT_441486 [Neurospora hispaniola]|uniref:BTB domain-containing protein n=1 Tax=Neurospora hispaniola TaxID=588809 RepID=A0AAJ0I6X8_9PEZI|nr:hypothetical protein B0T23DRAFT_441486 [Neurospora hispaniola]
MDPNRPLGIKSEPAEAPSMTTIPQAIPQAAPAAQSGFTAATIAASESITVATTPAGATTSTAAAKAPPAKKVTATARKPAAAKKAATVKTPAVPKTAAATKATAKATPKATPKTTAAKATPTTNTQNGAEVTPTTTTGTGTARPRGRPKKNADATDTATTASTASVAATAAAANDNTNITYTAKASTTSPPPAAPSSPIIVATANRPVTATATANRPSPSRSPSPGPGPASATAATRQTTNTRGRGRGRGRGTGRGRGRGRGGASTSSASSSTTPARKRTASAASIADADADTDPDHDDDADSDAYGRASKQRKVASTEGIAATLRAFEALRAGSASTSGAGSGPGPKQVVRAAAAAGGAGGNKGAAGPGTSVGKKGWSVDGQEINRRHKENDLHLLGTGEFSDATIHCLKKKWKVHKMRLSTRSAWFREAFAGSDGTGQISEINLHEQNADDIETMLRFMYADSLDDNLTRPSSLASPITTYVTLYNLGHTFRIPLLCRDSITLLGQYLDTKLLLLCTYSVPASGRSGVIDHSDPLLSPQSYANDLFSGIFQAYSGVSESTKLHSLLASFLWAGRDRLFRLPGLRQVVDQCPMLGTDVFKVQLGDNSSSFMPPTTIKLGNVPGGGGDVEELKAKHFGPTCSRLDHTRKTQHPDRCEACDEVFDEERWAKRVYNPFKVVVRPAAWCRRCVEGKTNPNAPGGGKGGKGGIGGRFDLGVGGPVVVDGDGEGAEGGGNGESHRRKGVLEDVVPMWRLRVGGDEE